MNHKRRGRLVISEIVNLFRGRKASCLLTCKSPNFPSWMDNNFPRLSRTKTRKKGNCIAAQNAPFAFPKSNKDHILQTAKCVLAVLIYTCLRVLFSYNLLLADSENKVRNETIESKSGSLRLQDLRLLHTTEVRTTHIRSDFDTDHDTSECLYDT